MKAVIDLRTLSINHQDALLDFLKARGLDCDDAAMLCLAMAIGQCKGNGMAIELFIDITKMMYQGMITQAIAEAL